MKKILIIGSTVVDVIIDLVDRLPRTGQDVHVKRQRLSLGGCAFNVSDSVRHMAVPYTLFSPIGGGVYGNFIREEFSKRGLSSPIPAPDEENGCCYCFVESTGERSFISYHGAEYRFRKEWFSLLDPSEYASVYICGLEIEEPTGIHIVEFLEAHPELPVFFAPGPRLGRISPSLLARLYRLRPVLHLNETEVCEAAGLPDFRKAGREIYRSTHNTVIVTLGDAGCWYYDGEEEELIPPVPCPRQADTIGAGDSHIGTVMACLLRGFSLREALAAANQVSSAVVGVSGALLSDEEFERLGLLPPKAPEASEPAEG